MIQSSDNILTAMSATEKGEAPPGVVLLEFASSGCGLLRLDSFSADGPG
jgi:hypothetical protein